MNKSVLVVGAGMGGIATALRLAKRGYKVQVIEKNENAGGRMNQLRKDGFTFDTGPSFFSMSYEFEELAKDCNIKLPFEFFELDPLYTVNFSNSPKSWLLYKDTEKLATQFKDIEPDFQEKMDRYLKKSGQIFNDTVDIVIKNNFNSVFHYLLSLLRVNPLHLPLVMRSFWRQVTRHFDSAEAQQIISLVSFFLGRTPFDTMAVYTLLSHTEFRHDGYYNVKGGMYNIINGFINELDKAGVTITYNTEITGFSEKKGKLDYLTDQNGKQWHSDIYVINSDAALFRGNIFKRQKFSDNRLKKMNWTMGYLTMYIGIKCKLPQVDHHNYYLGSNYHEYANNIPEKADTLEKPYYYVNVVSQNNSECAPEGCESLFFVCPVPNLLYKQQWDDRDKIAESIIDDFSRRINKDIKPEIVSKTIYTPEDWKRQFNLYKGGGLGLSHTMWQIGAFRPKNYDERYNNVFYVGASTIPGAGIPMAVISSRLAVERIVKTK